jgi:hypothetical protein
MPRATEEFLKQIQTINGRGLSGEEQDEIERWQKGRDLAHVVNSPGWDVVLEMLRSYAAKETERLVNTDPGDKDAVLAAHATAFAASRIFTLFVEDAQNLITQTSTVPEPVKEAMRHSPVPPESL